MNWWDTGKWKSENDGNCPKKELPEKEGDWLCNNRCICEMQKWPKKENLMAPNEEKNSHALEKKFPNL